jgi:phage FluMu protein Com
MLEMEVVLDFVCCSCGCSMGVTLRCAGKGLALAKNAVAAVSVPCPTCSGLNKVYFEPNGTLRRVAPHREPRLPVPSVN